MLSREWDLNPRPADYESAALPLSYLGIEYVGCCASNQNTYKSIIINKKYILETDYAIKEM